MNKVHEPLFPLAFHLICWFCLGVMFFAIYFGFSFKMWRERRNFEKKNYPKCYKQ